MVIELCPTHFAAAVWPKVEHFMADVVEHAKGEFTLDQLKADVLTGRYMMILAGEGNSPVGAAVVNFQNRRNARTAFFVALAGSGVTSPENFEQLKSILRSHGCTEIEAGMRPATLRLWKRIGFEEKYSIAGMKI